VSEPLAPRLAADVARIASEALPREVLARATDLLRDYLGVAIGGAGEESSRVIRRGLATPGAAGTATVLGRASASRRRTPRSRTAPPRTRSRWTIRTRAARSTWA
jgi:2-methylcitrate dehydratase PrpD